MSAGRKPLQTPETGDFHSPFDELGFCAAVEDMRSNSKSADELSLIHFEETIRQIAHIEAFEFMKRVSDVAAAQVFENLKKSGKYKGLPYRDDQGNVKRIQTLEELCVVKFGKTYRRMFDLSNNLQTLGPALYEQSERLGLRSIDYKALRSLPADDQALVKKAIEETQSRDDVLDILQELAAKNAREKETAAAEIDGLKGDIAAKEDRIAVKSRLLDEAEEKLARYKRLAPNQQLIELQKTATTTMLEALCVVEGQFRQSLQNIEDHQQEHGGDYRAFMSGLVRQIQHKLNIVNDQFMLDGTRPDAPPEWMTDQRFNELAPDSTMPPKH